MSSPISEIRAIGVVDYDHWKDAKEFTYTPQKLRPQDIDIKVEACGICGSDIHAANGDWGKAFKPLAVGHEIVGKIVALGDGVDKAKFKLGDRVGVGAQCDSCSECKRCHDNKENNCKKLVGTYQGIYPETGIKTQGGYASHVRINNKFVFKIPDSLDSNLVAPLLCGGITGLRPLMTAGVKEGTKVGVSGIGGIGHMTILFAKALGAEVTAISRNENKKEVATKLGADHYVSISNEEDLAKHEDTLDVVVNTGSSFSENGVASSLSLLKPYGQMIFITAPPVTEKIEISPFQLLQSNYSISGSAIGSPQDIEYMLELAVKGSIKPWIETIDINEANVHEAWERMERGDVKFRFVLTGYDKYFGN